MAQKFFDQGLILSYGFNHKKAHRSFQQAALLDSTLAMAYWGQALVLGPNINSTMNPDNNDEDWQKTQMAIRYADSASPNEQALIEALTFRYALLPHIQKVMLEGQGHGANLEAPEMVANDVADFLQKTSR